MFSPSVGQGKAAPLSRQSPSNVDTAPYNIFWAYVSYLGILLPSFCRL